MTNSVIPGVLRNTASASSVEKFVAESACPFIRVGYLDASLGRPFRKDYDGWNIQDQQNYEIGRLIFAAPDTKTAAAESRWVVGGAV